MVPFFAERAVKSEPIKRRGDRIDWWVAGAENHGVIVRVDSGSVTAPSREGGSGPVLYHGTAPVLPDVLTEEALELARTAEEAEGWWFPAVPSCLIAGEDVDAITDLQEIGPIVSGVERA